jgi:UDP-perosamine 4-acetyltransferase
MKTVIYGSRPDGQANVVRELADAFDQIELVGLIDDYPENAGRTVGELRVLGTGAMLPVLSAQGIEALLIGFGDAVGRADLVVRGLAAGLVFPRFVHPAAYCYASATVGVGAQVFPLAHLGARVSVGDGALVNTGAIVEHDANIRAGAVVYPGARLSGRVTLDEEATVGAGAVVLPDVVVGARAVVGAGAVVTRDVPAGERVAGVPAKPIGG